MIDALITWGAVVTYWTGVLITARVVYRNIYRSELASKHIYPYMDDDSMKQCKDSAHREARIGAAFLGVSWPVSVPVTGLGFAVVWVWRKIVLTEIEDTENVKIWELEKRRTGLQEDITRLEKDTDRMAGRSRPTSRRYRPGSKSAGPANAYEDPFGGGVDL